MTETERAVIPQQKPAPLPIFFMAAVGTAGLEEGGGGVGGVGWITGELRASVSFPSYLFSLFVSHSLALPPSPPSHRLTPSLIFNTLSLCPHSISRPRLPPTTSSSSSLFSSLLPPEGKEILPAAR